MSNPITEHLDSLKETPEELRDKQLTKLRKHIDRALIRSNPEKQQGPNASSATNYTSNRTYKLGPRDLADPDVFTVRRIDNVDQTDPSNPKLHHTHYEIRVESPGHTSTDLWFTVIDDEISDSMIAGVNGIGDVRPEPVTKSAEMFDKVLKDRLKAEDGGKAGKAATKLLAEEYRQ